MRTENTNQNGFTRRDFLKAGSVAGAGLLIGIHLTGREAVAGLATQPGGLHPAAGAGGAADSLKPSAWLQIDTDGTVSVLVDEAELGQGSSTGLPMILADELEADWSKIRILPPPEDPSTWVRVVSTGGSTSIRQGWDPFRKAGATAREMLRSAAAATWQVPVSSCRAENGAIVHVGTDRRLTYGELVDRAATLPVPKNPPLKKASEFRFIGKNMPRLDLPEKVAGTASFASDIKLPDMLVATVARPGVFGATLRRFDPARARSVDGVVDVFELPVLQVRGVGFPVGPGVVVVARNTWAALKGREALTVEWNDGPNQSHSSAAFFAHCAELAKEPGKVMKRTGDAERALAGAAHRVEAVYQLPFLDHAPMEPMTCTVHIQDGKVDVWAPTQSATAAQRVAAGVAGVAPGDVVMHVPVIGGGFGRRLQSDFVAEAVAVAKHVDGPVQLFWTREDTTRHGFYRPLTYHAMRGGIGANDRPVAWLHRIAGPEPGGLVLGGADQIPYEVPNQLVDYHLEDWGIPLGAWRSVSYTHMGFVVESFIDELAAACGQDPYRFRRGLMDGAPRLRGALDLAAEKIGWNQPPPAGRARGIAAVSSFGSHVAEAAEVSVDPKGSVRVHRVVFGIDCGQAVFPDAIAAQMEGATALAYSFTFKSGITIEGGAVKESNFTDYPIMRIDEMPEVEVYTIPGERPGGIGEPGIPPFAPAVTNAIFAATGHRVRTLPAGELQRG